MNDATLLLTGANRGLGLALAKEFAGRGWNVIATCRTPAAASDLEALTKSHPKLRVEVLDVTDVAAIAALAARYRETPIDVLFNNAALLGDRKDSAHAKQQLGGLDQDLFLRMMKTNVFGPLKLAESFAANVAASGQKKIVSLTSGLGSLSLMGSMSTFYFYQMTKAALNMGMRALRHDLAARGITVALLAPGLVATDMLRESGYRGEARTAAESAAMLYELVQALTPEDPGLPINVDGKVLPW